MEVAKNMGVFDDTPILLASNKPPCIVTADDVGQFTKWEGVIKTFSRVHGCGEKKDDGGGTVQHSKVAIQSEVEAVAQHQV